MGRHRILQIATSHVERASVFVRQAETLAGEHDVGLVFPYRPGEPLAAWRGYERFPVRLHGPRGMWLRPLALIEFFIGVCKAVRRFRPEVLHAHNDLALMLTWPLARLLGLRIVYDSHELWSGTVRCQRSALKRRLTKLRDGWLSRHSDLVIAAIEMRAEHMRRTYKLKKDPLVIYNAPPYQEPVQSNLAREFAASKGAPGARVVLYQGMLGDNRHLEDLVRAGKYLPEDICVVLLGYGQTDFFETLIRDEGAADRVFLHEPVYGQAYHEFTCSADLGVVMYEDICLNHRYCAPSKVFEYAMAGVPMIGNALPTLEMYLAEEGVGVIARSSQPEGIAQAIVKALADSNRYSLMKENCARFARKYTWEKEAAKLLRAYEELFSDE